MIVSELPVDLRPEFLRQYRAGVDAAREPAGYEGLQRVLRSWKVRGRLEATRQRLEAGEPFVPLSAILPDGSATGR